MKHLLPLLIFCLSFTVFATDGDGKNDKKTSEKTTKTEDANSLVKWMTFEEAWAASKENPKKILVDIYTDWCGPCKMMNKNTFGNKDIAKYINRNFYPVKLNAEMKDTVTIDGEIYTFVAQGRRGMHMLAGALMKDSRGYPTVTIFNEERQLLQAIPGYQNIIDMDKLLHFFAEDHYKTTPYNIFESTFRSRLAPKEN